ncbi:Ig-like domain-containing protein [Vibrio scophthalmi]|uniref:Bacterial Ig-like domain-containing protein n=1 Tax=Vibrio scophthalmi LMG 19158 TaxID=870967 RepID=F9RI25_9VIBR|nr:Ig-like domain-containing protein [Vibrio scophthalmi]EGU43458.1 hypothetical protein VIS19158_03607 [Vibrio scophthalmi LMG 19158]
MRMTDPNDAILTADTTPTFEGSAESDSEVILTVNKQSHPIDINEEGSWSFTLPQEHADRDGIYSWKHQEIKSDGSIKMSQGVITVDDIEPSVEALSREYTELSTNTQYLEIEEDKVAREETKYKNEQTEKVEFIGLLKADTISVNFSYQGEGVPVEVDPNDGIWKAYVEGVDTNDVYSVSFTNISGDVTTEQGKVSDLFSGHDLRQADIESVHSEVENTTYEEIDDSY